MYCSTILPFNMVTVSWFTMYTVIVTVYRVHGHYHCSLYYPSNPDNGH